MFYLYSKQLMEATLILFKKLFFLLKDNLIILFQIVGAFLMPIKLLIFMVSIMIFLDTISGIWKARKIGEKLTSKKLSRVVSKMVLYQVGLITFFILDKYLLGEFLKYFIDIPFFLTKIIAIFFVGIEVMSLNENIKQAYGVNFFQMAKHFLLRIKETKEDLTDIAKKD